MSQIRRKKYIRPTNETFDSCTHAIPRREHADRGWLRLPAAGVRKVVRRALGRKQRLDRAVRVQGALEQVDQHGLVIEQNVAFERAGLGDARAQQGEGVGLPGLDNNQVLNEDGNLVWCWKQDECEYKENIVKPNFDKFDMYSDPLSYLFISDERLDDKLVVLAQRAVVRLQIQLLELLVLPHPALRAEVGHGDRTQRLDKLLGLERRQIARRVAKRAEEGGGRASVFVFVSMVGLGGRARA